MGNLGAGGGGLTGRTLWALGDQLTYGSIVVFADEGVGIGGGQDPPFKEFSMKRALLAAAVVVCLSATCCFSQVTAGGAPPAVAGGGAGAGRGGAGAAAVALNRAFYAGELDIMSQQLTLTDEQKAKLQEKIDTMNKELDQFVQGAQSQIAAARRGMRGAGGGGGGGGRAAVLAGNPAVVKLQDDLQLLANQHQVILNQVLTPEQRLTWETYKLTRVLDPRWQPLGLTDDQKDKVKALVDDTAKQLAELTDGKTVSELQGKLYRKVVADVLTDAQVGKLLEGILPVQTGGGRGGAGGGAGRGAGGGAGAVVPAAQGI